jgi:cytidine deaminase
MSEDDFSELLEMTKHIECNAYTPLTNRSNGVALIAKNGEIFTGSSIEISNIASSVCAAKAVLIKAVSNGIREFAAVEITGDNADINYLWGDCRQAYAEFGTDLIVISEMYPQEPKLLSALLPQS